MTQTRNCGDEKTRLALEPLRLPYKVLVTRELCFREKCVKITLFPGCGRGAARYREWLRTCL